MAYNAVYGRVPLVPLDLNAGLPDGVGRDVNTRGIHRNREICVQAIVDATTRARILRALNTGTLEPAERAYTLADKVEFYREPGQKYLLGRTGPARVVDMAGVSRGTIKIQCRGRGLLILSRSHRLATSYLTPFSIATSSPHDRAFRVIRRHISHIPASRIQIYGMVHH